MSNKIRTTLLLIVIALLLIVVINQFASLHTQYQQAQDAAMIATGG